MIFFYVSGAFAYDVNKDITNLGPPAYDLTVVLAGIENVTNNYNGNVVPPNQGTFSSFAWGIVGGNTQLRWQYFWDGVNNSIDHGQTIHVGWKTQDHSSNILDMYWTDGVGNQIPGSFDYNITINSTKTAPLTFTVNWDNIFTPTGGPVATHHNLQCELHNITGTGTSCQPQCTKRRIGCTTCTTSWWCKFHRSSRRKCNFTNSTCGPKWFFRSGKI